MDADEETPLLTPTEERPKVSPYAICLPVFFSVIAAAMVIGVQQQWMILYLCSRFVYPDGSVLPGLFDEYLPGAMNSYPILQPHPDWEQCRGIPDIQV
jgi:hypothetical protein